jgi:hypothetical protein
MSCHGSQICPLVTQSDGEGLPVLSRGWMGLRAVGPHGRRQSYRRRGGGGNEKPILGRAATYLLEDVSKFLQKKVCFFFF